MRPTLTLLSLLFSLLSFCQSDHDITAYNASIPDGLGTPIHLPNLDFKSDFDISNIAPYDARIRILVVNSDSLYRKVFSNYKFSKDSVDAYRGDKMDWEYKWMVRYLADSLPSIDFSKTELVLYSACAHCLGNCAHAKGEKACHRGRCNFINSWFMREKIAGDKKEQILFR